LPTSVWLSSFSRRHPELLIEAHNTLTVARHQTLAEFEIFGPSRDWTSEIASFPDVIRVERMHVVPGLGRYRIRFRQPIHLRLAEKLEMSFRYPRTVSNGVVRLETVAQAHEIRRLVAELQSGGCRPRLVSIRRGNVRPTRPALTPVQRQLFRQAVAAGYFEVPRRINLTGLAQKVGRSKSTVSHTLAVVERKLVEQAAKVLD
jgi:predicted DNA binding protein